MGSTAFVVLVIRASFNVTYLNQDFHKKLVIEITQTFRRTNIQFIIAFWDIDIIYVNNKSVSLFNHTTMEGRLVIRILAKSKAVFLIWRIYLIYVKFSIVRIIFPFSFYNLFYSRLVIAFSYIIYFTMQSELTYGESDSIDRYSSTAIIILQPASLKFSLHILWVGCRKSYRMRIWIMF